jgi:hypothetical protein
MGMDVRYGLIYGVEVWDTILEDNVVIEKDSIPLYNRFTGNPDGFQPVTVRKYKLLINIPGFGNIGDLVEEDSFRDWIIERRNDINNEDDNGLFIYDYNGVKFFGIKAFNSEEPYLYPQDSCFEFKDETKSAKKVWNEFFPYLDGKLLLYMRVSV